MISPSIYLERDSLSKLPTLLPQLAQASQLILMTHPSLLALYGSSWIKTFKQLNPHCTVLEVAEGEQMKSLTQAIRCWGELAHRKVDRHAALIALGGGVVCDLAGFVGSSYLRGIQTYYFPTSLMAMVDAAIGGKTGVNAYGKKNFIGTFYSPCAVVIDPSYLQTLPLRELRSGLAEVIKYGMIDQARLFNFLEEHHQLLQNQTSSLWDSLILDCIAIKQKFVNQDPFDTTGQRAYLNYGHTFGHALESATRYRLFSHGEAVAIGMSCAAHFSQLLGLINQQIVERQDDLLKKFALPTTFHQIKPLQLIKLMKSDKKGICGKIHLILPTGIGKVLKVTDVNPLLLRQTLLAKMR